MKRLENGLMDGLNYIRDEKTNKIDWFKMIPLEYLYINNDKKSQIEKRLSKSFGEIQITEALDTELVITLQGIRWLLDTRGYKTVKTKIEQALPDYAAATCEITFIPNEEENLEQIYSQSASAHSGNTKSWYANYLIEASANRAFCRAVRFYLRVNIVSREELGANIEEEPKSINFSKQIKLLTDLMEKKHIKWEHIIDKLKKEEKWKEEYTNISELPKDIIFNLIERIKHIELPK